MSNYDDLIEQLDPIELYVLVAKNAGKDFALSKLPKAKITKAEQTLAELGLLEEAEVEEDETMEKVRAVVDMLNNATNGSYRARTKSTQQHIRGRLADGYTLEDFKLVIDHKADEWGGTQMRKYLRPQTLFRPGHFEAYLNAAKAPIFNSRDRLNDAELPAQTQHQYERYYEVVKRSMPGLFDSKCRILSHKEFADWIEMKPLPGLSARFSKQEFMARLNELHLELNGNSFVRRNYERVSDFLLYTFKQALR